MQSAATSPSEVFSITPELPKVDNPLVVWDQLYGCADSLVLSAAIKQKKCLWVVVTQDHQTALRLEHELKVFMDDVGIPVFNFPDWETLPYDVFSPLPEIVSDRLRFLSRLPQLKHGVLLVSINTLMYRTAPREHILANTLLVETGNTMNLDDVRKQFEEVGYQCVSRVVQHGEFAVRGSIFDLFPMGSSSPYRIELFDDEVDSIRTFDPDTQRSLEKVGKIESFPAKEFPFTDEAIKNFRRAYRTRFPDITLTNQLYQTVSKGIAPGGIEYYLPLFVEKTESLFDYFPSEVTLVSIEDCFPAAEEFYKEVERCFDQRRHDIQRPLLDPNELFLDPDQLREKMDHFPKVLVFNDRPFRKKQQSNTAVAASPLPNVAFQSTQKNPAEALLKFLDDFSGKTLFVAESPGHRQALLENFSKVEIFPKPINSWTHFIKNDVSPCILVAPMDHGLLMENMDVSIITESQLTGERAQQRRRRKRSSSRDLENIINNLNELHIGAPVVHRDHGVGRYRGLQILEIGEVATEFLMLEYAKDDKLYVPVSSLHLISRYSGASPEAAPLHKLGGEQWSRAKRKAIQRVRDAAAELLDLTARRAANPGFRFKVDKEQLDPFVAAFPFEETPDQETSINQVIEDMCSDKAMDRVICGDVGFGKTEVSMRAAFVVVQNAKQVAVLVPTTLLAQQHYNNFRDRFADWPIEVEVVSRFKSKKQQDEVIQRVVEGKVDILIGTHKLLQNTVTYKNLGLVIIDEEHRFGVRQKEYFKKLRCEVDLLTLTATPIPRTLSMAMSSLRDISIIASPPANRHAIKTFVSEWQQTLIQEACMREIRRGGQIFFLHNEVKSMARMAEEIARIVPQASIEIAHGQMPERQLERVMFDFYHQRFNLLLCSTIIESGIDIPSANTIIINRADKLGLAQLHQLRGRVGRSHHRAYAYLIVPPRKLMTKDAVKRLQAIEASGDLGAGFMLSSHDLEIRGAGELLGEEQSGQIHEIGFTLYTELLQRAVAALKSGEQPELSIPLDNGPEVELRVPALIPDDYLADVNARLVLYKRIANATSEAELDDLQIEMIDRFGLLPDASKNLFSTAQIKLNAVEIGIRKIEAGDTGGRLVFHPNPNIDPQKIIDLIQKNPKCYQLDGPEKLRFNYQTESPQKKITFINELLDHLSAQATVH